MLMAAAGVGRGFYRTPDCSKRLDGAAPKVWPEAVPLPAEVDKSSLVKRMERHGAGWLWVKATR